MKSAVIFLVLSMVVMMAEPGECFKWSNFFKKALTRCARGILGKEEAKELVEALEADFQNYKRDLRLREFD